MVPCTRWTGRGRGARGATRRRTRPLRYGSAARPVEQVQMGLQAGHMGLQAPLRTPTHLPPAILVEELERVALLHAGPPAGRRRRRPWQQLLDAHLRDDGARAAGWARGVAGRAGKAVGWASGAAGRSAHPLLELLLLRVLGGEGLELDERMALRRARRAGVRRAACGGVRRVERGYAAERKQGVAEEGCRGC